MSHPHVFEHHLETANTWIQETGQGLGLEATDEGRALHALRAGLHAIRDRLPAHEVLDLSAQMPTLIRGIFIEGWRLENDPTHIRDRAAMMARVKKELAPDVRLDPIDVLRSVIHVLHQHISEGEIRDIVATLPKPIASLWHDLTGHVLAAPPVDGHRTGYSR